MTILTFNGLCFILVFIFTMWDEYKDAGGGKDPYSFLPSVLCGCFVTVGLMYSARVEVFGGLLGTVGFEMLCVSVVIGIILKELIMAVEHKKTK
ncbi:MAG: hypothetical protein ACO1OT_18530 [Heyndrickxia sp.]